MKKLILMVATLLMLSCSCQTRTESTSSRAAASITDILTNANVRLKVSRIVDGDTFEGHIVTGGGSRTATTSEGGEGWWAQQMAVTVIRINGIDAPERGQFYGDVASAHLHWLISGKTLDLKLWQRDQYGRWIATAYADGKDIGAEMLKEGLAWHFEQYYYSAEYAKLQREAKQDGRGLWSDDRAVAPWVWRKMSKYGRDAYR